MAGSNPPNISGFPNWGYSKSSQSDFNNFGIDTRPDLGILMDFASPPILRCLRNPHVSSLAYSSSVFAGDERMTGWPKKKPQKNLLNCPHFQKPTRHLPNDFLLHQPRRQLLGEILLNFEKTMGSVVLHPVKPSEITGKPGDLTSKKWSFHGI